MLSGLSAAECEVCGREHCDIGPPLGHGPHGLRCCPKCRIATARERVVAWTAKMRRLFENKESKR